MNVKVFTLLLLLSCLTLSLRCQGQDKPLASIPIELHGDHVIIKVSLDGSDPLDFIFDSGDVLTVVDTEIAEDLNLDLNHEISAQSAQGSIQGALVKHNTIAIGGILIERNIKVYATSLKHLEISIGRDIDGIVGYELMHHHVVTLDYDNEKLDIFNFSDDYPKRGEAIPIQLYHHIPIIRAVATFNNWEQIEGEYFLNTGAGATLDFNSYFARQHNILDKTGDHYYYLIKGLGETETKHYEGYLRSFVFGNEIFLNLPIGISEVEKGIQGDHRTAGILGDHLLKYYNITFDYKKHLVYLEHNKNYGKKLVVNCSGIDIQFNDDFSRILIHQVIENSMAERENLKVNDELLEVNGRKAVDLGIIEILEALKEEGKTITLKIKAVDGNVRDVQLELKSLL